MCVVSMVYDHYRPLFPQVPTYPGPIVYPAPATELIPDPDFMKRTIDAFKEALEAAAKVDRLTGQPDCEDPEKAELKEQVRRLEKMVDLLLAERERSK